MLKGMHCLKQFAIIIMFNGEVGRTGCQFPHKDYVFLIKSNDNVNTTMYDGEVGVGIV